MYSQCAHFVKKYNAKVSCKPPVGVNTACSAEKAVFMKAGLSGSKPLLYFNYSYLDYLSIYKMVDSQ